MTLSRRRQGYNRPTSSDDAKPKSSRPFASQAGCPHRLHPQALAPCEPRLPSHPHATAPSSDDAKLTSSRPFASQRGCPHRLHHHAPATSFAQPAVNTACILTRPRLFARSAGCPHRLLLSALSSARDSSRAKQAVHTACILKVSRLFARSAGCRHRLRPQLDASIFFDINDLVSLEGRFTPSVIEARKRTTSIAASKST